MKKHKLIKSLLFAPLVTIPLVAASCGSNDKKDPKPTAPTIEASGAANALLKKFTAAEAKKFVDVAAFPSGTYSDFIFSTSATENKPPTKADFTKLIGSSKTNVSKSDENTVFTYDGAGAPYLYIWANINIQDPAATTKKNPKKMLVLVSAMNENFTVTVKTTASAKDNSGTVDITGYEASKEVAQFQMATAASHLYITNMLYAMSVNVNKPSGGISIADYKAAVEKLTSTSTKFDAKKTFEADAAAKITYASNTITYAPESAGAVFKDEIKSGATYTFKELAYNLNTKDGLLTITAPAVLST